MTKVMAVYTMDGEYYEYGNDEIIKISYHHAQGEGDRHYCDIYYSGGRLVTVFDLKKIVSEEVEE